MTRSVHRGLENLITNLGGRVLTHAGYPPTEPFRALLPTAEGKLLAIYAEPESPTVLTALYTAENTPGPAERVSKMGLDSDGQAQRYNVTAPQPLYAALLRGAGAVVLRVGDGVRVQQFAGTAGVAEGVAQHPVDAIRFDVTSPADLGHFAVAEALTLRRAGDFARVQTLAGHQTITLVRQQDDYSEIPTEPVLTETDTIHTVGVKLDVVGEAARWRKFHAAKGTLAKLALLGVVSFDDGYGEMVASYAETALARAAETLGRSLPLHRAITEELAHEERTRRWLESVVDHGETLTEYRARREAAQAATPGTEANGRRCTHRTTQKKLGWTPVDEGDTFYRGDARQTAAQVGWACHRCGAFLARAAVLRSQTDAPTPAAHHARRVLNKTPMRDWIVDFYYCPPGGALCTHTASPVSARGPEEAVRLARLTLPPTVTEHVTGHRARMLAW